MTTYLSPLFAHSKKIPVHFAVISAFVAFGFYRMRPVNYPVDSQIKSTVLDQLPKEVPAAKRKIVKKVMIPRYSDQDIMERIRRALVEDESFSANAKNIVIIAQQGRVVLIGPVHSLGERLRVRFLASRVTNGQSIADRLYISPYPRRFARG